MSDFEIAGISISPGERARVDIQVVRRYTHSDVSIPVQVVRGKKDGPTLFVCAAIHGDEINGVEIIRRLLRRKALERIRGTLLAVPVVNIHGFISQSRYLPDRRDLNRSFPGSAKGSLAARVADTFVQEVVRHSTHGIDLHTGAHHRTNLPQIRGWLDHEETDQLARVFGTPVIIDSNLRDGSLRQTVLEMELPMLLYEAGETLRFDEMSIKVGVRGVINVMRAIGMLPRLKNPRDTHPFVARSSHWTRAPESGLLVKGVPLGAKVKKGQSIGTITDLMGETETQVLAAHTGLVIGRSNLPLVNEGDSLFHIASFDKLTPVAEAVEAFTEEFDSL